MCPGITTPSRIRLEPVLVFSIHQYFRPQTIAGELKIKRGGGRGQEIPTPIPQQTWGRRWQPGYRLVFGRATMPLSHGTSITHVDLPQLPQAAKSIEQGQLGRQSQLANT